MIHLTLIVRRHGEKLLELNKNFLKKFESETFS